MKKICFVGIDNYPVLNSLYGSQYMGGESVQQTLLAKAFVQLGYEVSMVVWDMGQPDNETIDSIRVYKMCKMKAGIPGLRFLHPGATSILRALASADADLYYQSCAGMMTGIVSWFCKRKGKKFIFRIAHDTDCMQGKQLIRFWRDRKLYEYGLRNADLVATQNDPQINLLMHNYNIKGVWVNMVAQLPGEMIAKRDIDILWVNNIRDFKRPELAVRIAEKMPEYRVMMIGGPCTGHEKLYNKVENNAGRAPNLDFKGFVPYHQVNEYFSRAKVFINTSDSEGFPNSFLQAWMRGVPVISFFDPGGLIKEMKFGACPETLEQMVSDVREILGNKEKRELIAQRAKKYTCSHYSPPIIAQQYIDIFNNHFK